MYTVNALGDTKTITDRNGTVRTISYDVLGREASDAVTTLGSGVDGAVRRIETAYDGQGNAYLITSYDAASGGNIVNQVQREFNGLGQLTREYQSHSGAVNTSTTPKVQYGWSEMSGGNHSRLVSMTYPNGRVLNYNYSGLDSTISRLTSLSDNSGTLEEYAHLGLGTVVRRGHPEPGVDLIYLKQGSEGNGEAGDQYRGLDRFGRVIDQRWFDTSAEDDLDRFQYGYDRTSNRLYRENALDAVFSELYAYDTLDQLTSFARGQLNATKDGIVGTPSRSQAWDFDALGNWDSLTTNGTPEARTHNRQNQLTEIGSSSLTFDANGNLTTDEEGQQYVYDAWNRLVQVKDDANNVLASYQYDGVGQRIVEEVGETTRDLYYSSEWQVLEEQVEGEAEAQYVWSPVYVDALVLRDRDSDGNGSLDERLYVLHDANFNVTALLDTSGAVVERYVYDPYGKVTVLAPNWSTRGDSDFAWKHLHQGKAYSFVTGLYASWTRDYSPTHGRWLGTDRIGFEGGDTNLYRYVHNMPTNGTDPTGEWFWVALATGIGAIVGGVTALAEGRSFWGGVAVGAAAGFVAGVTFGASLAVGSAGLGAVGVTSGSGAIAYAGGAAVVVGSGVLAGQAGRATANVLTGNPIGQGLGQPGDMALDAALSLGLFGLFRLGRFNTVAPAPRGEAAPRNPMRPGVNQPNRQVDLWGGRNAPGPHGDPRAAGSTGRSIPTPSAPGRAGAGRNSGFSEISSAYLFHWC
ncbi:MAG: RHS repeat-associated core domain-containing protein [Gemmataceae bacterium]|nr:RHS repeat-associated core domain-containing protein [Gemmataceae bacterium]